jgi:hypothetical protein
MRSTRRLLRANADCVTINIPLISVLETLLNNFRKRHFTSLSPLGVPLKDSRNVCNLAL